MKVTLQRKPSVQLDFHLSKPASPAAEVVSQGAACEGADTRAHRCHPGVTSLSQLVACHQPDSQAGHEVLKPGLTAALAHAGSPSPHAPIASVPTLSRWKAAQVRAGEAPPGGSPTACQLPHLTPSSLVPSPALSRYSGFLFFPLQGPRNERSPGGSRPQAAPRPPPAALSPGQYRGAQPLPSAPAGGEPPGPEPGPARPLPRSLRLASSSSCFSSSELFIPPGSAPPHLAPLAPGAFPGRRPQPRGGLGERPGPAGSAHAQTPAAPQ